jgi:hypothetical protein
MSMFVYRIISESITRPPGTGKVVISVFVSTNTVLSAAASGLARYEMLRACGVTVTCLFEGTNVNNLEVAEFVGGFISSM